MRYVKIMVGIIFLRGRIDLGVFSLDVSIRSLARLYIEEYRERYSVECKESFIV